MHQFPKFRAYKHIRNVVIALFIVMTIFLMNDLGSRQAEATTPPDTGYGVAKPATFVIWLPWREIDYSSPVTLGYMYRDCTRPISTEKLHCNADYYALDFELPQGIPVHPVASGKVRFAGEVAGYGNVVLIDHDGPGTGYQSLYAHLDTINVGTEASVGLGTSIGTVGRTGNARGPHLHFALRKDSTNWGTNSGKAVVPEPFIGQKVYEGFGLRWGDYHDRWPGPLIAGTPPNPVDTTIPGGSWGSAAPTNNATIQKGQTVTFEVQGLPSDTKEVRFTVGYPNWSIMSDNFNSKVWRILARCWQGSSANGCDWVNNTTLKFNWVPNDTSDADICPATWLPCGPGNIKPANGNVCISFDVFDQSGNANYAPNGVNCSTLGLASTTSNIAYAADGNAGRLIYIVPDTTPPNPTDPNAWLLEFSKAQRPPLDYDIHIRVQWTSDFDAFRICFDGTNCQETSATELYYTWTTDGWSDGNHTLSVQYRRHSDNGNWASALSHEEQIYLSPNRAGISSCSGDGVYLKQGSDCIRLTADIRDLGPLGWGGRDGLVVSVQGPYEAWVYDGVDYMGNPRLIHSGQEVPVGGNVSSVNIEPAALPPPPLPDNPFVCDANTVSLYHFDEGSGNTATDACGRVTGSIDSSVSWVSGQFGNALGFPNTGGPRVNLGAPATLNLCPMSVEAWVKNIGGGRVAGQLAGGGNTGENKWLLSLNGARPMIEIWSAGGSRQQSSYKDLPDSNWHLLEFTFDCAHTGKLYVDNENVATLTSDAAWPNVNTTFEIGTGERIYPFSGSIDEVRISNIVRVPQVPAPVADFSASPTDGNAPHAVDFTDQSTGNITSWVWDFGDGSTSTTQNVSHYYNAPGHYTVSLAVTGPGGSDTQTQTALIHVSEPPPPPSVVLASPTSVLPNDPVSVSWTRLATTGNDWISLHPVNTPDSSYLSWQYSNGDSGSMEFTAPSTPGWYEFRQFRNGTKAATSNAFEVVGTVTSAPPVLKTPANGAAVYTRRPKLTWEAVPGATRYRVTVTKGATVVIDKNATGTSFTPPTALAYGRYTWHVAATQGVITPPSPDWVFYVTNMVNPANAATGLTGTPTFRWKSLGTGITYKLVIASDAVFKHPVRTVSRLKNLAYTLPASKTLPPGVYYWRIVTSSGKTMPGWTFTVGP